MGRRRNAGGQESSAPLVISKRKAARLLGIDRGRTLGDLLGAGQLRSVPWGKGTRIPLAEVERLASRGFTILEKAPRSKADRRPDAVPSPAPPKEQP
jgi:hypothetical protein